MNTNIDSSFSIPDSTRLHKMKVGKLSQEDLGRMWQFQGTVMSGGDRMGS